MFTSIKTSKINKDIVTDLSRKFNLGAENIIARIALTYSLSKDRKLSLSDIADSQGKEYSKNVLFGSNLPYYIGLICVKYGLYKTDKDIPKYIKLHIDDGLQLMNKELRDNPNLNGYDYLIDKITYGLEDILHIRRKLFFILINDIFTGVSDLMYHTDLSG